jgi:hypothetical protein
MIRKKSYMKHAMSWWNVRKKKKEKRKKKNMYFVNGWNVGVVRRVDTRIFPQKVPTTYNQKSFSFWRQQNDLVLNALRRPIEKTRQVIWDALHDYGRIKWQWTLANLEKAPDVAYRDVLDEFNSIWETKGLIVTRSSLVVMWKVRPRMGIISWSHLGLQWFSRGGCTLVLSCNSICAKKRK